MAVMTADRRNYLPRSLAERPQGSVYQTLGSDERFGDYRIVDQQFGGQLDERFGGHATSGSATICVAVIRQENGGNPADGCDT